MANSGRRAFAMSNLLVVVATATALLAGLAGADDRRPNILFIITDDQRADTVHALGNEHIRTPNLDRLARGGTVFGNAYCMGSTMPAVCLPSRTMLMSGLSLFRLGSLDGGSPSLPRSFREAGYVTYHYGKRGNVPHDLQKAFEHNHYLRDVADRTSGHPGKTIADHAVAFLKSRDRGEPLLMCLAFANPHDERVINAESRKVYEAAPPALPRNLMPFHPFNNGELRVRDEQLAPWPRTADDIREQLTDYYAIITYLDGQIGRVLDALRETGEYDNTLIVFCSDHGLALGSHGLMGKQSLYEHSMKAPLIITGPGIPNGRSEALVYLHDLYPTLCELAGVEVPGSLDGKSLAPILRGESQKVRDVVFTAYSDVQRAVRDDHWKLIRYPAIHKTQLFDLREDPDELHDLAGDPSQAGRVRDMLALLEEQQAAYGDRQPLTIDPPQPAEVDLSFFAREEE